MQICPNCGEENPPKFRLCGYCGTPLAAAAPPQEVRKLVTILFCDLKGSTALGESLDSEALREVMSRYFDAMSAAITRHGGTIEKFIGDAVMAVFGLPRVHEDDALRAVRAGREMQDALEHLNERLRAHYGVTLANRIGINTGEVVAGDAATGQRLVTGDPVNTAARLEQAAGSCEVLLGELTYRLVREYVEVEAVEPLELKGKAERVPAFRLVEVGTGRARMSRPRAVGREREAKALVDALDRSTGAGECVRVLVTGEPGMGKSRIVEEVAATVSDRALVIRGRCLSYGDGITFWPLVEAVREAAGIEETDDLAVAREKLATVLGENADDVFDRIASAVGLADRQHPITELYWAARKLVEILSRRRPLVLVLEDLHWAEPALLDLVDHVASTAADAPVLLLCIARPEILEARPAWAELEQVALGPLSPEESGAVVDTLLGGAEVAPAARHRIVAAAGGNPLYVEQLLAMLVDESRLRLVDGVWQADELEPGWVPPTINALLTARLDTLEREQRAVVEPAAVIGHQFQQRAVAELADEFVHGQVDRRLEELTRKRFVQPLSDELYRFDHILIRESVYDGLLKRTRASLHERFVQWADRVNGDRAIEFEEILGYHLEQAYRYLVELAPPDEHTLAIAVDGARRLASAGRRAFVRGDMAAAANLLLRATALLPPLDRRRLELFPDLGEALMQLGEFDRADSLLEDAAATADLAGEATLAASIGLVRLLVQLLAGSVDGWGDEATLVAERAIALCEEAGDDIALARGWRLLAWVSGQACRYGSAAQALERAIEHARRGRDLRQERRASTQYALSLVYGPVPVEDCVVRCEELTERVEGDRQAEAAVGCVLAQLEAMRGGFDRARTLYRRALATFEELGLALDAATVSLSSGRVELLAGDAAAAERELRRGYEYLAGIGERYLRSSVAGLLADAVAAQRRLDEAEALARETRELAAADDVDAQMLWRSAQAKVAASRGRLDEAEQLARESVDLLAPTDYCVNQTAAWATLAWVLYLGGRSDEAAEALTRARGLAHVKGSRIMLARLDELEAATASARPVAL